MLDIYNILTAVFAFLILFIVNRNLFTANNVFAGKEEKIRGYKEYKWFVISIGLFLMAETSWGFVHGLCGNIVYFFVDATIYNIAMVYTVYRCCRYVSRFLELHGRSAKILNIFGGGFFAADILMVIVNFFTPVLFWIDDDGVYHTGIARQIGMYVLVAVFILMAIMTLLASRETKGKTKAKIISIFFFSLFLTITLLIQALFPLYPCYSIGIVTGTVIIYVQILVAEQSEQLSQITTLNTHLEDTKTELERNVFELAKRQKLFEASNIGTWELIVKPGCRKSLRTDAKMKELMGLPADTTISDEEANDMLIERIVPEDMPQFMEYDKQLRLGARTECTYRWNNPILGERYLRCGGNIVSNTEDGIVCSGYHYDVTEVIKLEKELKLSIAASEMKTKFLQNMSHEIRTPLNAMFGFAQLLGMPDGTWSDEEKEKYNKIVYNTFFMLDMLVNDILDTADAQHDNYRLEMSDFEVNEMCQSALMSVEFRRPGNVEMKFTTDIDDEHRITSDSRRLQQILINFLTNACKNTAKGEIVLHVTDKEKPGMLVFSVTDTGKGVPPEKAELIFGRYTKLDQKVQGSGLGLNICDTIATKLNAKIYLDTSYTNGARFKLEVEDKIFDPSEQN